MPLRQSLKSSDLALGAELQQVLNAVVACLCGLDADGNMTVCNEALLKTTGYSADEVIGKNLHELLHHSRPAGTSYHADNCGFNHAINARQEIHVVGESYWRKDGTCFAAECWAHPLSQPIGPTKVILTFQDLTESLRDKEALRLSQEKFRRILASAPDVAWTSDRNGRVVYISPKVDAMLGYTTEEIRASGANLWLGLIHPEDFGRVNQAYRALFDDHVPFNEEYRIRRRDGVWIWVQDRAMGTHEEQGMLYADGFLCDITRRKQAEAELLSQAAFLEAQANATIDGFLVVDRSGQRLMQNHRLGELFSIPAELLADKDDANMLKYVVTLLKDPEAFLAKVNYLYKHPHETSRDEIELKNGTFLDRYSSPVVDKNGTYYGRIWTFRDITERKRSADALQQLSLAVEQSPVSVVITDPQGNISYVNRKFTDTTGYEPEEVIGKNPRILNARQSPPDLYRNLWTTITRGQEWRGEFCNKKKNGEIYWEASTITPMTNSNGAITHFLAVKEDITDRRRAEKELQLTQFSIEHASDSIQWMDSQGRIVYANQAACAILRRSREELLSLSVPDISPPFPREAWAAFWEQLKMRGSMTFESQLQTKPGELFPVEINANYLQFDGQEYCFASARDITERRALEAQLRQAQKLEGIGQLAAGIAHEINTPTQFVTDNLTFLRDSWKSIHELLEKYRGAIQNATPTLPPGIAATLAEAERSCDLNFIATETPRAIEQSLDGAQRVATIVRAMKEFSHPDSAEKTATNLNKAIDSTITVARNEWKYVSEIVTEFEENLPSVVCYPGDINQVVLNLIVNAAHSIKEKTKDGDKGRITIGTRTRGECVEISVTDTGNGIPEAIRNKVFDPFFTTKAVGKGTGQGLSLAYTVIVKKHGGKIWFETEVGEGTTFHITLPIQMARPAKEN
mgnify:CR=1 FL=1